MSIDNINIRKYFITKKKSYLLKFKQNKMSLIKYSILLNLPSNTKNTQEITR